LAKKPKKGGRPPRDKILNKKIYLFKGVSTHEDSWFIFLRGDFHSKKIILADSRE